MRFVSAPLRALLLVPHFFAGLAAALFVFPLVSRASSNRIMGAWSRILVVLCGARIEVGGAAIPTPIRRTGIDPERLGRLALANHVSWIDVFALNAVIPCRFVAKSEIGRWPLLGALVTRSGTLFIERGRRHAVASMNHKVRDHLKAGETIALFPEGTTTDGSTLLPFHSNLLAPAVETRAAILPVVIRYVQDGERSKAAALVGDTTIAASLIRILIARKLVIRITLLPLIEVEPHENRHALARAARDAIATELGIVDEPMRTHAHLVQSSPGVCDASQST